MKTEAIFSVLLVFFIISPYMILADEIHDAVKNGDFEKVKTLVEKNSAAVNVKDDRSCTPLHFAAEAGYKEIAEFLLSNGAEIDIQGVRKNNYNSSSDVDMF